MTWSRPLSACFCIAGLLGIYHEINTTEHSPPERKIQQQPTKKGAWNKELRCQPVKHYASPFYNANTFIVHIHPLQTNQLLKYNNPFLHSKKKPQNPNKPKNHQTTLNAESTWNSQNDLWRKRRGCQHEVYKPSYSTVNQVEHSNRCRADKAFHQVELKPSTPGKPGWSHVPHQHRPRVCLRPEVLKSHFTALALVPGAHYKLLENRRVSGLFSMTTTSVRKPQQGEGKAPDENPWLYSCQCT